MIGPRNRPSLRNPALKAALVLLAIGLVGAGVVGVSRQQNKTSERPVGTHKTVSVPANQPWTDTGVDLAEGSFLTISAKGTINFYSSEQALKVSSVQTPAGDQNCIPSDDPAAFPADFVAPNLNCWSLIGAIGNSAPFEVGTYTVLSSPTAGRLYLGVNDSIGNFGDNSEEWSASITVYGK